MSDSETKSTKSKRTSPKQEEEIAAVEVKKTKKSTATSERATKKKPEKKVAANFSEVFDESIEDDEDDIILPDTVQRREIKEKEEFVRKVLGDDDFMDASRSIKINFAKKKTRKEIEFVKAVSSAERFEPDYQTGLTFNQVTDRMTGGLRNFSRESNAKTYRSIFVGNIVTFFNILCVIVAAALIAVESFENLTFLVMMVINTAIGIIQEVRSKKSVEKLSLLSAPVAIVVRNGERATIPINEVVLDDVIYLENGKQICADSIVLKGEIEVNESLLTGESVPVLKKAGDTLYGGSFVSSGTCYARVDKVGDANYISTLTAFAKKYKKANSEILSSLKLFITIIGVFILLISPFLLMINYENATGVGVYEKLKGAIPQSSGAIIGMIPAGMFLLTSMALAVSVLNLARKKVLVQDNYCIEMLARVDMLCLDKTGTITDGTMRVRDVVQFKNETGNTLEEIVGSMLSATEDSNHTALALAHYFGYNKQLNPSIIMPFSSQRKVSAVTFENGMTYILGAPEYVLKEMGPRLERMVAEKAKEGFRVILLASSQMPIKDSKLPLNKKPLALICIEDHVREDAADTIKWFKDNGVAVRVISGDSPVTVCEVAKRVGIEKADMFVSLEGKTDSEVVELATQYTVFGRVTPEQKRILIRAFKAKGHTVAMTGDGVNDILALKEADCSVAIASGSEAARNVSHMVLQDNNFAKMPEVVFEGRRVVNNIQKSSSLYLMKTIFSIVVALLTILLKETYPFEPSLMLPLEWFVIGIPSFFLAFQSNKNKIEGKFLLNIIKRAVPAGLSLALGFAALFVFKKTIGLDDKTFKWMSVFVLMLGGWMMLIKMCMPLDFFRGALCIVCAAGLAGCMFLLPNVLPSIFAPKITDLTMAQILIVFVIAETSYFVVSMLTALLGKIKIN